MLAVLHAVLDRLGILRNQFLIASILASILVVLIIAFGPEPNVAMAGVFAIIVLVFLGFHYNDRAAQRQRSDEETTRKMKDTTDIYQGSADDLEG